MSLVLLSSAVSLAETWGVRPRGDVNCDWEVSMADVNTLVGDVAAGTAYNAGYTYYADVNGDQELSVSDINMVVDGILGKRLEAMASPSGTLPVLHVNTTGYRDITSKERYQEASWWLDAGTGSAYASVGSAAQPLGMRIRGRGHSTWDYMDKKPYRLKLDTKQSLLGMASNRHYVLLANAQYWMGQMNDALPFEIGRRMGMWAPQQRPVELVLNGEYKGMYFLTEQIRVDSHRVDVAEQADWESDSTLITGGWLIELDNYAGDATVVIPEGNGTQDLWFTTHSPEYLSPSQRTYITTLLRETDQAIYCTDKSDTTWERYIDMDTLAVYYLIEEVMDNVEAFSGSCYIHKDRGASTRLMFGPMWDFGSSYVRWDASEEHFIYESLPDYARTCWIREIVRFPRFLDCVRRHWREFYRDIYPTLDEYMDSYVSVIAAGGEADYVRWPELNGNNLKLRLDTYGKPCLHRKVEWLNQQWGDATAP